MTVGRGFTTHRSRDSADHPVSCVRSLACIACGLPHNLAAPRPRCTSCGAALEIQYDYGAARASIQRPRLRDRPCNIWRYAELLPLSGLPSVGIETGFTPLIRAQALGRRLGLRELYVKDDTVNRPSLSYKDRGVAVAVQHAKDAGHASIACVSTGNVGNALAAFAARAGLQAYVFYPAGLGSTKTGICHAYGARTFTVDATYDELNGVCRELGPRCGLPFVNIDLRPIYAEGAKTLTLEIAEQLQWRAPDHIVVPVAGATLINKVSKALDELVHVGLLAGSPTRIHAAQAAGSAPVADAVKAGRSQIEPVVPDTYARSIAIGAPGDGGRALEVIARTGGWAEVASDDEIGRAVDLLAATEGIFAEPAGGATIAVLQKLVQQGRIGGDDVAVAAVTGNGIKTLGDRPSQTATGKPPARRAEPVYPCDVDLLERWLASARAGRLTRNATRGARDI
jgi:threonine synthase